MSNMMTWKDDPQRFPHPSHAPLRPLGLGGVCGASLREWRLLLEAVSNPENISQPFHMTPDLDPYNNNWYIPSSSLSGGSRIWTCAVAPCTQWHPQPPSPPRCLPPPQARLHQRWCHASGAWRPRRPGYPTLPSLSPFPLKTAGSCTRSAAPATSARPRKHAAQEHFHVRAAPPGASAATTAPSTLVDGRQRHRLLSLSRPVRRQPRLLPVFWNCKGP
jgi:hypothetical protein